MPDKYAHAVPAPDEHERRAAVEGITALVKVWDGVQRGSPGAAITTTRPQRRAGAIRTRHNSLTPRPDRPVLPLEAPSWLGLVGETPGELCVQPVERVLVGLLS